MRIQIVGKFVVLAELDKGHREYDESGRTVFRAVVEGTRSRRCAKRGYYKALRRQGRLLTLSSHS